MIDPSLELQKAFVAALKADDEVTAIVAQRIYDAVPSDAVKPYVNLGQPQVLPDKADCLDGAEVSFPVHAWIAGPASVVAKQLGAAIAAALDDADLTLTGHRCVTCELEQTVYLDDPDGITKHVVVTFRILTEPTD